MCLECGEIPGSNYGESHWRAMELKTLFHQLQEKNNRIRIIYSAIKYHVWMPKNKITNKILSCHLIITNQGKMYQVSKSMIIMRVNRANNVSNKKKLQNIKRNWKRAHEPKNTGKNVYQKLKTLNRATQWKCQYKNRPMIIPVKSKFQWRIGKENWL